MEQPPIQPITAESHPDIWALLQPSEADAEARALMDELLTLGKQTEALLTPEPPTDVEPNR